MKFQIKIILSFAFIIAIIFFIINTITINFFEQVGKEYVIQTIDKKFFSKKDFTEHKFQEYLKTVFLWECLLVLSSMLILYKLIDRLFKQERSYQDFLELILITLSHKFRNFLAIHRGNIEILKIKQDQRALQRLENSYNYIQEDFHRVLKTINSFKNTSDIKEKINLKEIVEEILSVIETNSKIVVNLKDIFINANRQRVENMIFSLIENAVKYSNKKIHIKLSKKILAIKNDISQGEKGSGIGLKIVESLAKNEGFKIKFRAKEDSYLAVIKFT